MVERLAGRLAELAPLERYNLVSDTWAASWPARPRSPTCCAWPGPWSTRARATRACGRWCSGPSACSTGSSPTPTGRPWPPAVRTLLGPLAAAPRAGIPATTTTSAPRRCGRRCCAPSAPSATIPTSQAEAARRFAAGRRPTALHPDTESAILDIVASNGGAPEYEAYPGPLPDPGQPPGGEPLPLRPGLVRRPRPGRPDLRSGPDRGPHPERSLRPAVAGGQPGHRAGRLAADHRGVGRAGGQVPLQHPPPDARRGPGPVHPTRAGRRR